METSVFEGKQSLPSYNLPEVVIRSWQAYRNLSEPVKVREQHHEG